MEAKDTSDKLSRVFLDLKRDINAFVVRVHNLPGGPELAKAQAEIKERVQRIFTGCFRLITVLVWIKRCFICVVPNA